MAHCTSSARLCSFRSLTFGPVAADSLRVDFFSPPRAITARYIKESLNALTGQHHGQPSSCNTALTVGKTFGQDVPKQGVPGTRPPATHISSPGGSAAVTPGSLWSTLPSF